MTFGHYGCCATGKLRIRTPKGTPKRSNDLWSHPVAMLLLYYYFFFKTRGEAGHAQNILPVRGSSGHVTLSHPVKKAPLGRILRNLLLRLRRTYFRTCHVIDITSGSTSQHLRKCDLSCRHILLISIRGARFISKTIF